MAGRLRAISAAFGLGAGSTLTILFSNHGGGDSRRRGVGKASITLPNFCMFVCCMKGVKPVFCPCKLRFLREDRGYPLKGMGFWLDMPVSRYVALEAGDSSPTDEELHRIADFFKVNVDYLMSWE